MGMEGDPGRFLMPTRFLSRTELERVDSFPGGERRRISARRDFRLDSEECRSFEGSEGAVVRCLELDQAVAKGSLSPARQGCGR